MPGLVPGIHVLRRGEAWMAGTSPAMTEKEKEAAAYAAIPRARERRFGRYIAIYFDSRK
jgi:hypothetical protein